ncbi:hypothetical protein FOWG_02351 [Fusarium oxysporum f. sp. lycopersici MN25]|uniref:Uncharacterized protein n=1 Tax=Fusarium oxysporum Fo47 TaxID=660027 RepID=W9KKP0_FUSOX|nr:hypothetical protein FOZG_05531 [Fusarium oxysporum Fo47]EWZ98118.1 hypothetical protein FOWG_02351 [Fusarium oxysporum f. sp. lycopersici MN25]
MTEPIFDPLQSDLVVQFLNKQLPVMCCQPALLFTGVLWPMDFQPSCRPLLEFDGSSNSI